jgi:hypothetical protein
VQDVDWYVISAVSPASGASATFTLSAIFAFWAAAPRLVVGELQGASNETRDSGGSFGDHKAGDIVERLRIPPVTSIVRVQDFGKWRPLFDRDAEMQKASGLTNPRVVEDKNELVVLF